MDYKLLNEIYYVIGALYESSKIGFSEYQRIYTMLELYENPSIKAWKKEEPSIEGWKKRAILVQKTWKNKVILDKKLNDLASVI